LKSSSTVFAFLISSANCNGVWPNEVFVLILYNETQVPTTRRKLDEIIDIRESCKIPEFFQKPLVPKAKNTAISW
jgi:hypothetical protein